MPRTLAPLIARYLKERVDTGEIIAAEAPNLRSAMEGRTYEPRDDEAA